MPAHAITTRCLLVCPAVAEEGIDVRSCQLVVRFDLPDTAQVIWGV